MKIIKTKENPKFKPVTVCFETKEELQYVTKILGLGRYNIAEVFTGSTQFSSREMYETFEEACKEQCIDLEETGSFYIERD